MNLLRKLLAIGVLTVAAYTYSTSAQAQDCYLYCASISCDYCGACDGVCFWDYYGWCTSLWCS